MAKAERWIPGALNEETGQFKELERAPYAFEGPHLNVGIRNGRKLAAGKSGLTDREFRVLVWFWFATEESEGPVMMTRADIAEELHMNPDTLSRTIKVLHKARMLLESGSIGRTTFYRCTPYLVFLGSGFEHRTAVKDWNPPTTEVRDPKSKARGKNGKNGKPGAETPGTPGTKGDQS